MRHGPAIAPHQGNRRNIHSGHETRQAQQSPKMRHKIALAMPAQVISSIGM
jgi:hypothetical protein